MRFKISFCIPEYNCVNAASKLVKSLLDIPMDCFQVIVSDNQSTDGTFEELSRISDDRLKILQNETNVGARLNWLNALDEGEGDWLYLVMGRDRLDASCIPTLVEYLTRLDSENVGVFKDRKTRDKRICVYHSKDEATECVFSMEHPTGIVFKKEAFSSIDDRKEVFSTTFPYPEMDMAFRIINKGYGVAKGWTGVFIYQTYINKATFESNFSPTKDERNLYFHPIIRAKDTVHIVRNIKTLDIPKEAGIRLFKSVMEAYSDYFMAWKRLLCEDSVNMRHYGLSRRLVKKEELLELFGEAWNLFEKENFCNDEKQVIGEAFDKLKNQINSYNSEGKLYNEKIKRVFWGRLISKCKSEHISKYFEKLKVKTVAVYGYGDIGASLCDLLSNSGIDVAYAIDRNSIYYYSEMKILTMEDNLPCVDAVIISLLENTIEIERSLKSKYTTGDTSIICIEDMLFQL